MQELQLVTVGNVLIGGTTKPITIVALDSQNNPCKYILKLFTEKQIEQGISVAKEIVCCELAQHFNLICPDYGVLNFDHLEIKDLYDSERLLSLDKGYKFCSKFVEQSVIFNPLVTNSFLKDYDAASIFAFDFLIYNIDRGGIRNKPNLLINDEVFLLIDHELTFPFVDTDQVLSYENYLRNYPFKHHILYRYLKSLRNKEHLFDEFLEMLKLLNINELNSIFDGLEAYNIPHRNRNKFIEYLAWAKQNVAIFERLLKWMINGH